MFCLFYFCFPPPLLKLKQIDRESCTAFNVQLHRCGSFSPHDRVIDWRGLVVGWLGGVTGGVNPIARLLLLLGKKNMMMSRQHKSAESCLSLTPPFVPTVFLCPSHTILFFGGDGFLFFFPNVDQKVPSHHRPLVDKSIGPRRR